MAISRSIMLSKNPYLNTLFTSPLGNDRRDQRERLNDIHSTGYSIWLVKFSFAEVNYLVSIHMQHTYLCICAYSEKLLHELFQIFITYYNHISSSSPWISSKIIGCSAQISVWPHVYPFVHPNKVHSQVQYVLCILKNFPLGMCQKGLVVLLMSAF